MKKLKPLKVLSIDWDYFIDATETQRLMLFPDGGNENLGIKLTTNIWTTHYLPRDGVLNISTSEDYETIKTYLKTLLVDNKLGSVSKVVTDSHKVIYDVVQPFYQRPIELIHIDHHSDLYNIGQDVNCGNWLNFLFDKAEHLRVNWVHNKDSEIDSETMDRYKSRLTETSKPLSQVLVPGYIPDVLFLCRSSCWSPPHLDSSFDELVDLLKSSKKDLLYSNDIDNRYTQEFEANVNLYNNFVVNNFPK